MPIPSRDTWADLDDSYFFTHEGDADKQIELRCVSYNNVPGPPIPIRGAVRSGLGTPWPTESTTTTWSFLHARRGFALPRPAKAVKWRA